MQASFMDFIDESHKNEHKHGLVIVNVHTGT